MAGADPSFGEVHILRALFILDEKTTGRKKLVKILGVGEGSVRTIIKRLSSTGLISSSRLGHALTEKGRNYLNKKLEKISKPRVLNSRGLVEDKIQSAVVVRQAADKVDKAVNLRDIALKAGADGAVILVFDGRLRFPQTDMDLSKYPGAKTELEGWDIREGDVVVVGFASSKHKAEDGALAACLELV